MKLIFTAKPFSGNRINFFRTHLEKLNYTVVDNNEFNLIYHEKEDDIWFIDAYVSQNNEEVTKKYFKTYEDKILNFKGKICFYSLDDCVWTFDNLYTKDILNRVDAWLVGAKHKPFSPYAMHPIFYKTILIPRFNVSYIDEPVNKKDNKIILFSRNTNQIRSEIISKIKSGKHFDKFLGGIVNSSYQSDKDLIVSEVENTDLYKLHDTCKISICPPGHVNWTYRHLESMRSKCAIMSLDVRDHNIEWLFQEKCNGIFFPLDINKLVETIDHIFSNEKETQEIIDLSHYVYKQYFELNRDNTFKKLTWNLIVNELENKNIYFK